VNYTFTGQEEYDEVGLYNYGARLYDPALGRFINANTIVPDHIDPQSLNRYSYVRNNSLRYIDPTGMKFLEWFWENSFGKDSGDSGGESSGGGSDVFSAIDNFFNRTTEAFRAFGVIGL
jgi:RHS repeat-associated protein